ncbi:hypothetical protein, partial [Plasmodium yoelii yoelii]
KQQPITLKKSSSKLRSMVSK